MNLDHTGIDQGQEINRTVIQELEEQIDQYHKDTAHGGESWDSSGDGFNRGPVMSQPVKDSSQRGKEPSLRYRPNIHPPNRYNPGQYPILIKGTQGYYVTWQTLDLVGLVARLPDIHEGAGKWIRAFEEETVGNLLTLI